MSIDVLNETDHEVEEVEFVELSRYVLEAMRVHPQAELCTGNRQPYAPEHTLTAAAGYAAGSLRGEIEAQYVGEQFSDFANTSAPTADGQKGEIAAYTVWNAALNYRFGKATSGFVAVKNLADKTYIVDRTRGIQVGMPRLVQVGVKYNF